MRSTTVENIKIIKQETQTNPPPHPAEPPFLEYPWISPTRRQNQK